MKIGILTFHSQTNYGGVLQCWALRQALLQLGHEVVVIDRWMHPTHKNLDGPFGHARVRDWLFIFGQIALGCRVVMHIRRQLRTKAFVNMLGLTDYHFYDWKDAPKSLGVDCLVVGSDQVWHGGDWGYPDPNPYLLLNAPEIKAIAYAASFGMKSLPKEFDYRRGFSRFAAISVRELEGVSLVKEAGYKRPVVHVVDPTLLISPRVWYKAWPPIAVRNLKRKRLVCYFLEIKSDEVRAEISSWARKYGYDVKILMSSCVRPVPRGIKNFLRRVKNIVLDFGILPRVEIAGMYGPQDFVKAFSGADACITDSFHAVMFSSIYKLNCRFIKPISDGRRKMFARVEEFARATVKGPLIVDGIVNALNSLCRDATTEYMEDSVRARRGESLRWLDDALKDVSRSLRS